MTSMLITSLTLSLLRMSYAGRSANTAHEIDLLSCRDSVEADETSLLHTHLLVRRREGSANQSRITSSTKFQSKQSQDRERSANRSRVTSFTKFQSKQSQDRERRANRSRVTSFTKFQSKQSQDRERRANRSRVTSFIKFRSKQSQDPEEPKQSQAPEEGNIDSEGFHWYGEGPNGNPCTICDPPQPGRGYDGVGILTSDLPADPDLASLHDKGNYVRRDDCGNHYYDSDDVAFSDYIYNTTDATHNAYPGYTNAWCETGNQQAAADALANRDQFYHGKSADMGTAEQCGDGCTYDFYYCKNNGFLSLAARQAYAGSFETAQAYIRNFCSEKESQFGKGVIEGIKNSWLDGIHEAGMLRDPPGPTKEEAARLGAWLCSMGGTNGLKGGQSDGAIADCGYCQYTYGDLGDGQICMYQECDGWDPLTGMPVTEFVTKAPLVGKSSASSFALLSSFTIVVFSNM